MPRLASCTPRILAFCAAIVFLSGMASGTTPVVSVKLPVAGSQNNSPVHYVASASSPDCPQGIAAMRIYSAPYTGVYTVDAASLDTRVPISPGYFTTVVEAWDNCGGVGTTTVDVIVKNPKLVPPRFLYDTEASTQKIAGFGVDPTSGALTPLAQSPISVSAAPGLVSSDQGGYRLYVTASEYLNAYFINRSNGDLTPVPGSPIQAGGAGVTAVGVAVAPSGKFVYVTLSSFNGGTQGVAGFQVASDGSLAAVPGSPFPAGDQPVSITVDPTGRYVYVGHVGGSATGYDLDAFTIDETTGSLTPVVGEPYVIPSPAGCYLCGGGGVLDLKTDVNGTYLFAPVGGDGTIAVYRIDQSNGSLSAVSDSPFVLGEPDSPTEPGAEPTSISVDPRNLYLYVDAASTDAGGNTTRNAIFFLPFNSSTGDFDSGGTFRIPKDECDQSSMRADPSGRFLYSAADVCQPEIGPGVILGFSTHPSAAGKLPLLRGSPYAVEDDPVSSSDNIAVTP